MKILISIIIHYNLYSIMKFYKKIDAINHYNKLKNKNEFKLFQKDINISGSKCFYILRPEDMFKLIITEETPNYYEFWTENTRLLFCIDLDYYQEDKLQLSQENLLIKIINIVIEGAKKYYKYEYNVEDIIILENDFIENNKYSAHIIFTGLNFMNYLVCKDFYMKLEKDYNIKNLYVDKNIYSMTCLRLYGNSKI